MTHSATLLALDALACFRLTRLVVADTITAPIRARLIGSRPAVTMDIGAQRMMVAARPRLAEFLTCPWCVSPYLAVAVVACQALAAAVWIYPAAVLAFSAVAGLISEHS
jgi:hypothetical protein